jgi:2-amino-4-hydroxy-6-hydroxymethyldihydropteridine diphosphokinase
VIAVREPVDAYVALGANLGDRAGQLSAAVDRLCATSGVTFSRKSSLFETSPVGGPAGQGDYLNAVVAVRTTLDAHSLLRRCLDIEHELGRRRTVPNAARPVDLDLLLFGDRVIETESLEVPHPRLHQRKFVLEPLAEIAPGVTHPVLGLTIEALLDRLPAGEERVTRMVVAGWTAGP